MKKRSLGILVFCLLLFGLCGTAFAAEKTKSPYYITVNLTANVVTVYEKDTAGNYTVPIKAFRCSGGTDTPRRDIPDECEIRMARIIWECVGAVCHTHYGAVSLSFCTLF